MMSFVVVLAEASFGVSTEAVRGAPGALSCSHSPSEPRGRGAGR